jgi:hypothetical protein
VLYDAIDADALDGMSDGRTTPTRSRSSSRPTTRS